jgi:hypothetical protein
MELNHYLKEKCLKDDQRQIARHPRSILEDWRTEATTLRPLPEKPFSIYELAELAVDSHSRICIKTNRYSVPVSLLGRKVTAQWNSDKITVFHQGKEVAVHPRNYGTYQEILDLDHYLELLYYKPGALSGSIPLKQAKEKDSWPEEYEKLWKILKERYGEAEGTRELLNVLMLHRQFPAEEVHIAVGLAIEYGCYQSGAVFLLLRQVQKTEEIPPPLEGLGKLERYEREASGDLSAYNELLFYHEIKGTIQ